MKIIPMYLPQFHQIPENDEWWGKGFTEWTNMKKSKPLFDGHYQPRIPLDNNYYDLSDVEVLRWQAKIARDHGIYGFCFYHYWFNSHLLLEKPMELLLENPDIDINYCISWANENWTNAWVSKDNKILIGHDFDDEEDWIKHFDYLLQFFKDKRYMLENNKPILVIYVPHHIKKLKEMLSVWTNLAIKNGFDGITYIYQNAKSHFDETMDKKLFDYGIEFEPGYTNLSSMNNNKKLYYIWMPKISSWLQKNLNIHIGKLNKSNKLKTQNYDEVWEKCLNRIPDSENMIPTAFVDWDNTPRRQERGEVFIGANPMKFKTYLKRLVIKTRDVYKSDKMFLFAWNEWAEGGYLEPDEKYGYGYLEAIKEILKETE